MLSFLETELILSRSLVMRGVDVFLFGRAWKTDLDSEGMINSGDLGLAIMFMTRLIAVTSVLWIDNSFHFGR